MSTESPRISPEDELIRGLVRTAAPNPHPCAECPWLLDGAGQLKTGAHRVLSRLDYGSERRRLWMGLRDEGPQTCHPTDARLPPIRPGKRPEQPRECAGALALVGTELDVLERVFGGDVGAYVRARPDGLTRRGVAWWSERRRLWPERFAQVDRGVVARESGVSDARTPRGALNR